MQQVDSLTFILVSELTIGLLIGIILYLVWVIRRKNRDQSTVRDFIGKLKSAENDRNTELKTRLQAITRTTDEQLSLLLDEVFLQEKTLYKQVIEVFLQRSMDSVIDIDARVRAIIEPFCKLLSDSKGVDESVLFDLQKARKLIEDQTERMKQLRFESNQLGEQLNTALETLDEVSSEYSKMFGESKSAEELEVSQKKMLNLFRQSEMKIKQINQTKDTGDANAWG
ncbi:MAG: hypothetical protein EPN21_08990 [Methylococcaceae bacterium]|nr:MAG: hypothetical protein EPN21_08990 [Methylococcaceae bacterium]